MTRTGTRVLTQVVVELTSDVLVVPSGAANLELDHIAVFLDGLPATVGEATAPDVAIAVTLQARTSKLTPASTALPFACVHDAHAHSHTASA